MATQKQIDDIVQIFNCERPKMPLRDINAVNMGVGAVIRYLHESKGETDVTAGDISEFLHVSTARVAVLLRKMESKGLIARIRSKNDARVTIVRLTEHGEETAESMLEKLRQQIGKAIDRVGYERMLNFVETFHELQDIWQPPAHKI